MTEIGNAHRVGHITTEIEIRLSIFWLLGIRVSQEESPLFRAGRMSTILHDKKLFGIPVITIMELIVLGYCILLIYELEILLTIYKT